MKALMVTPNICEGRNQEIIDQIVYEVSNFKKVKLMDSSSDYNHNRSVLTFIGSPEDVLEATFRMASKALDLIDMRKHKGNHPRVGAVDAVPFTPIGDLAMEEAVKIAHQFGEFMGKSGVPVYYYGEAENKMRAGKSEVGKGKLTQQLLGEYEGLPERLKDDSWPPDEGPREFNPKNGAVTVGARGYLICFNINLGTQDIKIAKKIAKSIRYSGGGYRDVQSIGVALEKEGLVQVSTMTSRDIDTPLHLLLETVKFEAASFGVQVVGTEVNGPIPLTSIHETLKYYLRAHSFSLDQIVEKSLLSLYEFS